MTKLYVNDEITRFDGIQNSVGDSDPEPDPDVFGLPGSGSISQRSGPDPAPSFFSQTRGADCNNVCKIKITQNFSKKFNF